MGEVRIQSERRCRERLARDAHVVPLRAGERPLHIPFFNLHRPVGDLLRAGHDRARARLWSLMAERGDAMRRNGEPPYAHATIRTPHGVLRLTMLREHDISVRLTVRPGLWLTSGELVVQGTTLSDVLQQAVVGETVARVTGLDASHPLSGLHVLRARVLGTGTRLRLDMPRDEMRLDELGEDPDEILAMTRREALAIAA